MKKKILSLFLIVFLTLLLFPIRSQAKDGGTVVYTAVLYTVKDVHQFKSTPPNMPQEYYEGLIVKVFGVEIFNNVK